MARRMLSVLTLIVVFLLALGPAAPAPSAGQEAPPSPPSEPPPEPQPEPAATPLPPLPPDSGAGRRVVYSVSEQRVWLVEHDESVHASWLVSGRRGIPRPGTYSIYSRSRWSSANGGRVRMEFMVRFVRPRGGQAIGFHSIPVDRRGRQIQSEAELGQTRSRGCVRQRRADAEQLWHWAPDGTAVRVTR